MPTKGLSNISSGPIIFFPSRMHYMVLNIIVIQALLAFTSSPEKSSWERHILKFKTCKPRFFQVAVCYAFGCTFRRRSVSTSKTRPRARTSFAGGI